MAQKQSACKTLCFRAPIAREAWANRLLFGREHSSASRRCLTPAGRVDGLWLAVAPFPSRTGSADMTGMASGWQRQVPRPPEPGQAGMGSAVFRGRWVPVASGTQLHPPGVLVLSAGPQPPCLQVSAPVSAIQLSQHPVSSPSPHHTLPCLPAALGSCTGSFHLSPPREASPSRAHGPLTIPTLALPQAQSCCSPTIL